jgi:cobalt/nickel transport system permease protein
MVCAVLLALSDTIPLTLGLAAMLSWHFMIGIGEAFITLAITSFLWRTRPDLIYDSPKASIRQDE